MSSPAELLRRHLTPAENAAVTSVVVDAALRRARAGGRPRTRVEVAAVLVYRGSLSSRVPRLESRPLRRPLLARLSGARNRVRPERPTTLRPHLRPHLRPVPVRPVPRAA